MKRTPLRPGRGLTRSGPPRRRTPLAPVNPARRDRQHLRNFAGPFDGYDHGSHVRTLPCCVPDCSVAGWRSRVEAAHAIVRGMGGAKGSWRHLVPLCCVHHAVFDEDFGADLEAFELAYGVDLLAVAARLAAAAPHGGAGPPV